MLAAPRYLAESERRAGRFDLASGVMSTLGASLLVYGIVRSASAGWGDAVTLAALAAGLGLVALFVAGQARAAQPIMPLRLFDSRERVRRLRGTIPLHRRARELDVLHDPVPPGRERLQPAAGRPGVPAADDRRAGGRAVPPASDATVRERAPADRGHRLHHDRRGVAEPRSRRHGVRDRRRAADDRLRDRAGLRAEHAHDGGHGRSRRRRRGRRGRTDQRGPPPRRRRRPRHPGHRVRRRRARARRCACRPRSAAPRCCWRSRSSSCSSSVPVRSRSPSPRPPRKHHHADHQELPRHHARPERLVHRRGLHRHRRDADRPLARGLGVASISPRAPAPPGTRTRSARRSSSPRASASASARAARSRSSAPATASSSSPARTTGTAPPPTRFMAHIAIQEADDSGSPVTWGEHVTDEQYAAAPPLDA